MTSLTILGRKSWGFRGPLGPAIMPTLPSRGLYVHHSVTRPTSSPAADMRTLERIGQQRFGRLSYSHAYHIATRTFLEGQGNYIGAHTGGQNSSTHGIVLIGNYDAHLLPDYVEEDLADFVRFGASRNWWQPVILGGHRDAPGASTSCPGKHGMAMLRAAQSLLAKPKGITMLSEADIDRIAAKVTEQLTPVVADAVARRLGFWDHRNERFRTYNGDMVAVREGIREIGGVVGTKNKYAPTGENPA